MPIRNPFRKNATGLDVQDDSHRTTGSRQPSPVDVKRPTEYKLSEINDSGVYLPPSPTEEKPTFWHSKSTASTTSSNHRSMLSETEPFNISRESFDSYRRSFDISGQAAVRQSLEVRPRMSLDGHRSKLPRSSLNENRPSFETTPLEEDGLEDVSLNDDPKPKKRGIFARFGDSSDNNANTDSRPNSSHHGFHFTGRRRGQSNSQGSELKPMTNQYNNVPRVVVDS